eukprot:3158423-Rhodomonas_salina.3
MLLSQLSLVGQGVGSETWDTTYGDQARENFHEYSGGMLGGLCPLPADCNGVPSGDTGYGSHGGSAHNANLVETMYGFHRDKFWKTNTRWVSK